MKLRQGSRLELSSALHAGGATLKYLIVSCFKYQGVIMTTNGRTFTEHITDRMRRTVATTVAEQAPRYESVSPQLYFI